MPYLIAIIVAALIAMLLVRLNVVTSSRLMSFGYAVLGGALTVTVLRFFVGPLGPIGVAIGAVIGGAILLFLARSDKS